MDKKAKKRIEILQERMRKLRLQLSGAKKQLDDPEDVRTLERQIAETEAELTRLKAS